MLCIQCTHLPLALRRSGAPSSRRAWRSEHLGVLYCEQCGTVLLPEGTADALLDKLSQLARFGLTGDPRPILEPSHPES